MVRGSFYDCIWSSNRLQDGVGSYKCLCATLYSGRPSRFDGDGGSITTRGVDYTIKRSASGGAESSKKDQAPALLGALCFQKQLRLDKTKTRSSQGHETCC